MTLGWAGPAWLDRRYPAEPRVGEGTHRPALTPRSSHLFERRLFRRARAGGTGRSQKRKMVPRILTSHLYIPGPSSSGGRHTPRRKPQSCRRRCRLRRLSHHSQGSVADLWRVPKAHRYNVRRTTRGPRLPPLLTSPPPAQPEDIFDLNLRTRSLGPLLPSLATRMPAGRSRSNRWWDRKGCGRGFLFGRANPEAARGTRPTEYTWGFSTQKEALPRPEIQ